MACSVKECREILINHYSSVVAKIDFEDTYFVGDGNKFFIDSQSYLGELVKKIDQEIDVVLKSKENLENVFIKLKKSLDKFISEKYFYYLKTRFPMTFALACTVKSYLDVDLKKYTVFCDNECSLEQKNIKSYLKYIFNAHSEQLLKFKNDLEAQSAFKLCLIDTHFSFQLVL